MWGKIGRTVKLVIRIIYEYPICQAGIFVKIMRIYGGVRTA